MKRLEGFTLGLRTLRFAQRVSSKWFPSATAQVWVERHAELNERLLDIEERYTHAIVVSLGTDISTFSLSVEEAQWLRDALTEALREAAQ